MKLRSSSSRMERQVRNHGRILLFVSVGLLLTCASMTGTFGWTLGRTTFDKVLYTAGLVLIDVGGAALMAGSGIYAASKRRRAAVWAMVAAVMCCAVTLLGIGGFQAENRESQVAARKKVVGLADNSIEWFKTITREFSKEKTAKGAATTNTDAMVAGMETIERTVRDQQNKLMSGEIAAVADGQSTLISRLTGVSEDTARSWTTAFMTLAFLVAQYSCLWFYGFLRHEIEPFVGAASHPTNPPRLPRTLDKPSAEEAKSEALAKVLKTVENGEEVCVTEWGEKLGINKGQASTLLREFQRDGHIKLVYRGRRLIAVEPTKLRLLNGGLEPESA